MPLLTATNLKLAYGERVIIDGVSISLEPGERIGIVGRNGCGKSSLMKMLAGILPFDSGMVSLQRGCRSGYLHQDPKFPEGETLRGAAEAAFAELHRLHQELDKVFEKMAAIGNEPDSHDELEKLIKTQADLDERMQAAGGYAIDHKIEAVLHGLGFTDAQFGVPVTALSGGQRGRLALAKLLLENPDVMLLDEPTNHLDIDGCLWLESFLKNEFKGAVIMVSHDRYLLDNVVHRIIEVEQARLIDYPGNYVAFREIRAQRRLAQMRAYENQQTQFKKEEEYIRRYKAGQRAKQAQGRLSKLERAKEQTTIERPMEVDAFRLTLPKSERTGDIVVAARGIGKSYPADDGSTKLLFKELDVIVARGERWGIIGPNGAGKSTLVRCMLNEQKPDEGTVRLGSNVKVGYYRQTHDHIEGEPTVWQYIQSVILKEAPQQAYSEQQARNLAGAFLFGGDEQEKQMASLSGGERSRAVLAGLLASAKNVLVLDEPTNHLDIPSAERLEEALTAPEEDGDKTGYDGTLILISHDRALIDATCDHLLIFDGHGGVETFNGNYTDWHEKHTKRQREQAAQDTQEKRRREEAEKARKASEEAKKKADTKPSQGNVGNTGNRNGNRSNGSGSGNGSNAKNPLAKLRTEQIEDRIAKIEARIKEIDLRMADAEVWRDPRKCQQFGDERQNLAKELEPLEFEWMNRTGG